MSFLNLVALFAEGVDRNSEQALDYWMYGKVALFAEGVDRNNLIVGYWKDAELSPSSRRAWIEIRYGCPRSS